MIDRTNTRPLHLHTLESLVADLVNGKAIQTASGDHFSLQNDQSRSALNWYRERGAASWTSQVRGPIGEELVDAIINPPPQLPTLVTRPEDSNVRRLRLNKLEAHRFAGLHKFGTPGTPPPNYVAELLL